MSDSTHLKLVALVSYIIGILASDQATGLLICGLGGLAYIASFFADKSA